MKKVFYSAMVVLALASCKKDYTCECTTTEIYDGIADDPYTVTTIVKGVSKADAEASSNCVSYETSAIDEDGETYEEIKDCTLSK
jgi:hypothetical protein